MEPEINPFSIYFQIVLPENEMKNAYAHQHGS